MPKLFCTITLEDTPNPVHVKQVQDGLMAYNLQYAPDDEYRPLFVFLRDGQQQVMGGLLGNTYWGWLYVSIFWLNEVVRGQGYGGQMLKAAESEALRRGCHHVHLDTLSFQALPFYENQGYTIFGTLEDLPPGHKRYFLQKQLV